MTTQTDAQRQNILTRILDWLRAGYPQGVPQQDYIVLLGLLHRRLTETEVEQVALQLRSEGKVDASEDEIRAACREALHGTPEQADVSRVQSRLAAGGWPLADPQDDAAVPAE